MPRRGQISKRDVLSDPLYNSKLVTKLINNVMLDGKKGVAQRIMILTVCPEDGLTRRRGRTMRLSTEWFATWITMRRLTN